MQQLSNLSDYIGEATIGEKHQVVLVKPARKIAKKLKPGTKVIVTPVDDSSVNIRVKSKDWVEENYGMDKESWKGIDAAKYIKKLRDEWEI